MKAIKKRSTTKTAFEGELIEEYGAEKLSKRTVREEDKTITLYYSEEYRDEAKFDHGHVATWCDGKGWEFDRGQYAEEDNKEKQQEEKQ